MPISKEAIKNAMDYKSFYGSYFHELPDAKTGGWIKKPVLCPFHPDKNPSFGINLDTGAFNCFSCGASGDVFSFVQKFSSVDFNQACFILGLHCGLSDDDNEYKIDPEIEKRKARQAELDRFHSFEIDVLDYCRDLISLMSQCIKDLAEIDFFHDGILILERRIIALEQVQDLILSDDLPGRLEYYADQIRGS